MTLPAHVWTREDPALEERLVAVVYARLNRPLRVACVAGGGCTAITLLAAGEVSEVVAVDRDPAQLHMVALKLAAMATLEPHEQLVLLGVEPGDRPALYRRVAPGLAPDARAYWDGHEGAIAAGLVHEAAVDRRFLTLAGRLAEAGLDPMAHPKEALLDPVWHDAFATAFPEGASGNRRALGAHLAETLAQRLWSELPQENYLLRGLFQPRFRLEARQAPPAMLPEVQAAVRERGLDRLSLVEGEIAAIADRGPFDVVSLSAVTDRLSPAALPGLFDAMRRSLAPGGALIARRVVGVSPLAPVVGEHLKVDAPLSQTLAREDRAAWTSEVVVAFR